MKSSCKIFLAFSITALIFIGLGCQRTPGSQVEKEAQTPQRPNIIFIMADDHAEKAISAYGHDLIQTPNIDRIAKEGILFKNSFVTNSICAPSRATLLTGKFSHINGKRDNLDRFNGDQITFPKLLQDAGYQTAVIGKWHLKSVPQGFDEWKTLVGQGDYYQPEFVQNGDTSTVKGYVTEVITDFVLEYLTGREQDRPFCLLYHHKAPHRGWMPNTQDLDMFNGEDIPLPTSFYDEYNDRPAAREAEMKIADMFLSSDMKLMPGYYDVENGKGGNDQFDAEASWQKQYSRMTGQQRREWDQHYLPINEAFKKANLSGKALAEWKFQRYMKDYLRCIKSVDDNVGRVLDYLDESGLAENTLVVYTSDQGFYLGEHGWYDKRFMYEESLRTPLVMRYPQEIPAGTVSSDLVQNLDHASTFLDFAGVQPPGDMQGRSLRPLMGSTDTADWRDAIYYHYYEYPRGWHKVKRHYGMRTERYKLIHFYNDIDHWELYDLQNDPNEMNNLYDHVEYRQVQEELHLKLDTLRSTYGDTDPVATL
ncbi:MAG: sulfatase [Cytophagales bacterium]|nr:sulfatase [Cytophagales bacterium]